MHRGIFDNTSSQRSGAAEAEGGNISSFQEPQANSTTQPSDLLDALGADFSSSSGGRMFPSSGFVSVSSDSSPSTSARSTTSNSARSQPPNPSDVSFWMDQPPSPQRPWSMSTKDQRVSPDPFYFGGQGGSAASSEQQQQLQQTETETNRRSSLFSPRSCTSLLITNVSSSAQEEVLLDMFKKHGQIRSINTEDKLQGRVTISYYDLREAEKAMEALSGVHLCGKQLHISYNNRPGFTEPGMLTIHGLEPGMRNSEIARRLSSMYGDVVDVEMLSNGARVVEFYDTRDAQRASSDPQAWRLGSNVVVELGGVLLPNQQTGFKQQQHHRLSPPTSQPPQSQFSQQQYFGQEKQGPVLSIPALRDSGFGGLEEIGGGGSVGSGAGLGSESARSEGSAGSFRDSGLFLSPSQGVRQRPLSTSDVLPEELMSSNPLTDDSILPRPRQNKQIIPPIPRLHEAVSLQLNQDKLGVSAPGSGGINRSPGDSGRSEESFSSARSLESVGSHNSHSPSGTPRQQQQQQQQQPPQQKSFPSVMVEGASYGHPHPHQCPGSGQPSSTHYDPQYQGMGFSQQLSQVQSTPYHPLGHQYSSQSPQSQPQPQHQQPQQRNEGNSLFVSSSEALGYQFSQPNSGGRTQPAPRSEVLGSGRGSGRQSLPSDRSSMGGDTSSGRSTDAPPPHRMRSSVDSPDMGGFSMEQHLFPSQHTGFTPSARSAPSGRSFEGESFSARSAPGNMSGYGAEDLGDRFQQLSVQSSFPVDQGVYREYNSNAAHSQYLHAGGPAMMGDQYSSKASQYGLPFNMGVYPPPSSTSGGGFPNGGGALLQESYNGSTPSSASSFGYPDSIPCDPYTGAPYNVGGGQLSAYGNLAPEEGSGDLYGPQQQQQQQHPGNMSYPSHPSSLYPSHLQQYGGGIPYQGGCDERYQGGMWSGDVFGAEMQHQASRLSPGDAGSGSNSARSDGGHGGGMLSPVFQPQSYFGGQGQGPLPLPQQPPPQQQPQPQHHQQYHGHHHGTASHHHPHPQHHPHHHSHPHQHQHGGASGGGVGSGGSGPQRGARSYPLHHHGGYRPSEDMGANSSTHKSSTSHRQQSNGTQFALDPDRAREGGDPRTTIMIRNIPNKYTQRMLLDEIDNYFVGTYDFFYLPIDFKNKCNVGYAFMNFFDARKVADFYERYSGQRWSKFNSEKVCQVSYARIQGRDGLISHFQNSSLLFEEQNYRPLLFSPTGEEEEFPVGPYARKRRGPYPPSS